MKKLIIFTLFFFITQIIFSQIVYIEVFTAEKDIKKGSLLNFKNKNQISTFKKEVKKDDIEGYKNIGNLMRRFKLFAAKDIPAGTLITQENTMYTAYKNPIFDNQIQPNKRLIAMPTMFSPNSNIKTIDILYKSDGQSQILESDVPVLYKKQINGYTVLYIQSDLNTIQHIATYRNKGVLSLKISQKQLCFWLFIHSIIACLKISRLLLYLLKLGIIFLLTLRGNLYEYDR